MTRFTVFFVVKRFIILEQTSLIFVIYFLGCFFIGIFVDVAICRLVKDLKLFEDSEVEIKSTTYAASASTPVDEFISLAKALED